MPFVVAVFTLGALLITGASTGRMGPAACDYYEAPPGAVVDESYEHAPRANVTIFPFVLNCSYATGAPEREVVGHDLGTVPLVGSVLFIVLAPLVWAPRRRPEPTQVNDQQASRS